MIATALPNNALITMKGVDDVSRSNGLVLHLKEKLYRLHGHTGLVYGLVIPVNIKHFLPKLVYIVTYDPKL